MDKVKHTLDSHQFAFLLSCALTNDSISLSSRNEELLRLQGKDLDLNLRTDAGSPYFTITLTFRKTNQADALKGISLLHNCNLLQFQYGEKNASMTFVAGSRYAISPQPIKAWI
jgi:hypothetical protein